MKGILIGFGIFLAASVLYIINAMRPFVANKATGLSVLTGSTVFNTNWWISFALTLAASYSFFRR